MLQKSLIVLALCGWIGLGLAHIAIVMTGSEGWRPDRSAPGAASVIGHPHDTDPRMVAGPLELVRAADPADTLVVVVPAETDSADLLYTRFQLAHLLYPRRVRMQRASDRVIANPHLVVVAPVREVFAARAGMPTSVGDATAPGCGAAATAFEHVRLECAQ